MKSKTKRPGTRCFAPILAALSIVSCELVRYPLPFDNPIDPDLSYGFIREIGEQEYTDRRGVRQPQDMAVSPDGSCVLLAPSGNGGIAVVDMASGSLTWSGSQYHQGLAADLARGRLYAANGGEIYSVDMATGAETLVIGEYVEPGEEGYFWYHRLTVTPEGQIVVLREHGWPVDETMWQSEREVRFISSSGNVLGSVALPQDWWWIPNLAVSEQWIFCTRDGYVVMLDRNTGAQVGSISWDPGLGELTRRMSPDLPLNGFGAEDLCYDAPTGHLLVALNYSAPGSPTCYVLEPSLASPMVGQLGDSMRLWNAYLSVGPDGTVYGVSREGLVESLTTGTELFENPPLRPEEYRDIEGLALGPDGKVYLVDRGLRVVMTYDPVTAVFAKIVLPTAEPGYVGEATSLAVGPTGLAISDHGVVAAYTPSGGLVEEWTLTSPGWVRDLEFLPSGDLLALYYDPIELFLLTPGDPTPAGPLSCSGLAIPQVLITSAAIAVDPQGRILAAISSNHEAHWGYLSLEGSGLVYQDVWSSASDELFTSGTLDAARCRTEGVAAGPECVWVGLPDLYARVRFSTDGVVLGSYVGEEWSPDTIPNTGGYGNVYTFGQFSVDTRGRMWLRQDWGPVWLVGPQ